MESRRTSHFQRFSERYCVPLLCHFRPELPVLQNSKPSCTPLFFTGGVFFCRFRKKNDFFRKTVPHVEGECYVLYYKGVGKGAEAMLYDNAVDGIVGFTDEGCPLVLSEHSCKSWLPGARPTLNIRTCWYCRYADFRKTADFVLAQSVCRCPQNRLPIVAGSKNESLQTKGEQEQ